MASPERPLLVSGAGIQRPLPERVRPRGGAKNPNKARQVERLGPRFAALQDALGAKRGALQSDPSGAAIEQVLVFETNGPVSELYETIGRTPGLEWLADEDLRDLVPDKDFFDSKKPTKRVSAQLYLILFNHRALGQLLSVWRAWCKGAPVPDGFRAWLDVFRKLRDIRRWSARDRLHETGVLDYWRDRVAAGYETVSVEIELWYRRSELRAAAEDRVRAHVSRASGQVLGSCTLDPIAYHGIVAKLPIRAVEEMLANPEIELLQCDEIRLVRPTGQAGAPIIVAPPNEDVSAEIAAEELGDPVVALLDGLPLENHRRLAGRLVVDDPDGWAETYPVASRCHGTAVASLILHGDLGANEEPSRRRLYVRPIMRPDTFDGKTEVAPDDTSWVDLIHRAVRRIVDGAGSDPAAQFVRIINLSIGDPYQPFVRSMSPLAKLLDWLAWRHSVLFVVSAGNHHAPIQIASGPAQAVTPAALVTALASAQRHRRILSPSEAINVVTVGSTSEDACGVVQMRDARHHDFSLPEGLPSPISGLGRGYRRIVKPDVLAAGGRVVFTAGEVVGGDACYEPAVRPRFPPGQKVAAPSSVPGDTSGVRFTAGTSNAAALTSRLAAALVDVVQDLSDQSNAEQLVKVPIALWLRTLIVHGASWSREAVTLLKRTLGTESNKHTLTDEISAFLGFGSIRADRVLACSPERVTVLAGGNIGADERFVHRIPLPPSLNAHTAWRRVTMTMSWFSPINPTHRKYRRAALWFEPPADDNVLGVRRSGVDWKAARRGTVQHEVVEGDRRAINIQPDASLEVPVSCIADAGTLEGRIPYAMAITLEVAPGVNTKIYDEVRARIVPRVAIRPKG